VLLSHAPYFDKALHFSILDLLFLEVGRLVEGLS
jgi:hypothetical protein